MSADVNLEAGSNDPEGAAGRHQVNAALSEDALQTAERLLSSDRVVPPREESESEYLPVVTPEDHSQDNLESGLHPSDDGGEDHESGSESAEKMMTIIEHLDELRARMLRSMGYLLAGIAIGFAFAKDILRALEAPAGNMTFQALSIEEPLIVFCKVAFYTGAILASPFILLEISKFVSPGLTRRERKVMTPIVVGSPALFCLGAAFAYFLVLPPMLGFFNSFGQGVTPINQRLDFYVSFVSTILLYMGLCFQMPIILFALSFTGLVSSKQLLSVWRYAIVVSAIVSAVITPDPTALSMLIVMGALTSLYFVSVFLLKMFGK